MRIYGNSIMLIQLSHSCRKFPFYNKFIGRRLAEGYAIKYEKYSNNVLFYSWSIAV